MKTHQTLTQLRVAQQARFKMIAHDIHAVHKMIAEDGKGDFQELTAGGVKTKTLRAMGHPFGRLNGGDPSTGGRGVRDRAKFKTLLTRKGVLPPLPINIQTGKLHAAITLNGPHGVRHAYDLFSNVHDGRQYVLRPGGTSKMVGRGLLGQWGMLRKRHRARRAAYVDVLRASLKTRA